MTPTRTALMTAVLVVVAGWSSWRAVRPARPSVADVRARFEPMRPASQAGTTVERLSRHLAARPAGRWVERRLGVDLRLAGCTVAEVLARMVTAVAVGFVAVLLGVGALVATGVLSASPLWLLVIVGLPVALGARALSEVVAAARARRRSLRRVTNDFVQLLAVALTTNRSIEESIEFAAGAGEGAEFDLLRATVRSARPMGVPVWDALAAMADDYGLDDLKALTGALRRQADVGVSVAQTVRTEAAAMRSRQLDDLKDQADRANADLSVPTLGMVLGMVLFLAFPIAQQISEAFA